MSNNFLFLEFRDRDICTLLHELRKLFNGKPSKSNIHITVRGPYVEPLKEKDVKPFQDIVNNDLITISGVSMFNNNGCYVVYLGVNSENLHEIWWKRDYPKGVYGFNPHISLYQGTNKQLAYRIKDFLTAENLVLETKRFELTPYVSSQYCLFSDEQRRFEKHFLHLILDRRVKGDILIRAKKMVDECNVTTQEIIE